MKRKPILLAASLIAAVASTTLISWVGNPDTALPSWTFNDTVPNKGERDFDRELKQIDEAKKQLNSTMEKAIDKMVADMEASLSQMDLEKIKLDAEHMANAVDLDKLQKDIEASLSKIDLDKMEQEMKEAHPHLSDKEKAQLKKDLEQARKDMMKAREEMKKELAKAKEEIKNSSAQRKEDVAKGIEEAKKEIEKARADIKNEKVNIRKELANAQVEIEKAKKQIQGYQEMVYAMEAEGLLDTSKDYIIKKKDNTITVNGKELNQAQLEKYGKYFSEKEMTIQKKNGELNIGNHNVDL